MYGTCFYLAPPPLGLHKLTYPPSATQRPNVSLHLHQWKIDGSIFSPPPPPCVVPPKGDAHFSKNIGTTAGGIDKGCTLYLCD